MKNILPIITTALLFIANRAEAAPPSFTGAQPLAGEITWFPGVGVDTWVASRIESAWSEWEKISEGAVRPVRIDHGTPRVVFYCSDDFPIGSLDGTEITVGDDVNVKLRHVNLSNQVCSNPSRILMLHVVGHALGWDNDISTDDGVMGVKMAWGFGDAGDRGFTSDDVEEFSSWYSQLRR